jgi:hypothetical protein
MSFHRRYFDKEKIFTFGKSYDYLDFNKWITGPDSQVSSDYFTECFLKAYFESDKSERLLLYLSLEKGESFVTDLMKCIRVCRNEKNSKEHYSSIKKYIGLFFYKWPEEYFTYKNLLKWKKKLK